MYQPTSSHTDIVFRRTMKGQAAALSSLACQLDPDHQRLLLMVNGFTSLETLNSLSPFDDGAEHIALSLRMSGLIEEADTQYQSPPMQSPWRLADR